MEIRAGTSGYSYPAWKGHFYPDDLPQKQMLSYYSSQLPCVEINNTFYRLPSEKMLAGWLEQTSEPFSFVLKASRRITHFGKLEDVDDTLRHLLQTTAVLGDRLGAHLFQLPPYLKKDVARLGAFLELLPAGTRAAFEFRNTSWFDDETYALLADHDAALVVADGGKVEVPFVSTATWATCAFAAMPTKTRILTPGSIAYEDKPGRGRSCSSSTRTKAPATDGGALFGGCEPVSAAELRPTRNVVNGLRGRLVAGFAVTLLVGVAGGLAASPASTVAQDSFALSRLQQELNSVRFKLEFESDRLSREVESLRSRLQNVEYRGQGNSTLPRPQRDRPLCRTPATS